MTSTQPVRRLAPPDRRAHIRVGKRSCPLLRGCVCCPAYTSRRRGSENDNCKLDHPAEERLCSPPWPEQIRPCPERARWSQDPLPDVAGWRAPRHECCIECGKITARRWTRPDGQVVPWCAGDLPEPPKPEPVKRKVRYNPTLRRHSWAKTSEHWKSCAWCRIRVHNLPDPHSPRWFQEWDWPDRGGGAQSPENNYAGGTVPDCSGPTE